MKKLRILSHPSYMGNWGEEHEDLPDLNRCSWDDSVTAEDKILHGIEAQELKREVSFALAGLAEREAKVLVCRYLLGMSRGKTAKHIKRVS